MSREEFYHLVVEIRARRERGDFKTADLATIDKLLSTFGRFGIGQQDTLTLVSPDIVQRLQRFAAAIMGKAEWTREEVLALNDEVWQ